MFQKEVNPLDSRHIYTILLTI